MCASSLPTPPNSTRRHTADDGRTSSSSSSSGSSGTSRAAKKLKKDSLGTTLTVTPPRLLPRGFMRFSCTQRFFPAFHKMSVLGVGWWFDGLVWLVD